MRIVDTHLHLIYPERFRYPWLSGAPAINKRWSAEDYFAQASTLGIEAALHMEVDVAEADMIAETQFMTSANSGIVGAIASCRPEDDGFDAFLDRVAAIDGVKGLRRVLHQSPDALSETDLFASNLSKLADRQLTFDLCVRADQLHIGRSLVDRVTDVQFVLDHCGVPDIAGDDFQSWRRAISDIAKRPNLVAKLSGIVAYAGPNWTADDLRPYAEHIIEAFGWNRLVWGSDYPVCTLTADLERWVEATHTLLSGSSEDEKARLLHRNAERIYRIS
ncbi:amidohydrolase family protein [Pelagibacterium sp.]|uniref:amidohydrolase family protein n=1 Tax=Pelagibacterium sp. TaxID=1967288 RepID=UPI003A8CE5CB